jgi:hypothetical protein
MQQQQAQVLLMQLLNEKQTQKKKKQQQVLKRQMMIRHATDDLEAASSLEIEACHILLDTFQALPHHNRKPRLHLEEIAQSSFEPGQTPQNTVE